MITGGWLDGMSGTCALLVGALVASVGWLIVLAWVRDRFAAERRDWHGVARMKVTS